MECLCLQIPTSKPALRICLGERYGDCCSNFLRISHCPFRRVTSRCKYALSSILSIKNGCPVFVQRRSSLGRKQVKRETFIKIHLSAFNLHNPLVIFTGFCNVICYNFLYSLHIYVVYKHSFILCNNVKSIYGRY